MRLKPDQIPNNESIPALMKSRFRVSDGHGLYLIHATVPETYGWRMDYCFEGKRKTLSLGMFQDVPLSAARALKDHYRSLLSEGINPSEWRAALGGSTSALAAAHHLIVSTSFRDDSFAAAALRWHAHRKDEWDTGYAIKVLGRIKNHLLPTIGSMSLRAISAPEIAKLCSAIQASGKLETGVRVFKMCRRIIDLAIAQGRLKSNPCISVTEILKTPPKNHFPAILDPARFSQLLRDIEGYRGTIKVRRALKLKAMLMVRGVELRCAKWQEFDLGRSLWRIPAMRMKGRKDRKRNGRDHVVPLPKEAVEILARMFEEQFDYPSEFVFPARGKPGRCMSGNTLNKALRIMGYSTKTEMTAHGFRATARTLIVESLKLPKELPELQLAHTVPDQNGEAYNRAQHLPERREMLQSWAEYLDELRRLGPEGLSAGDEFTPITILDRKQVELMLIQISKSTKYQT